jgi:hypothetical protein
MRAKNLPEEYNQLEMRRLQLAVCQALDSFDPNAL